MSPLELSFKQQYDQLSLRITDLQKQIDGLKNIETQVNSIIDRAQSNRPASCSQETEKCRQFEVLVPVVVRFSRDFEKQTNANESARLQKRRPQGKGIAVARHSPAVEAGVGRRWSGGDTG